MSASTDIAVADGPSRLPKERKVYRVLHAVNGEHYAGAERVQDLLAEYLPAYGVEVGFACVKADAFPMRRHYLQAPCWSIPVAHPWPRNAARSLAELAFSEAFDAIHAHTPRSLWAAHAAARRARLPLVYTMHDLSLAEPDTLPRQWIKQRTVRLLRQADVLIAVSPAALDLAEQLGLGTRRRLIPNGVPCQEVRRTTPRGGRPVVVGTVALFRPRKGVETLIEAAARLRREGDDIELRLVGPFETAEYERSVRRELARHGFAAEHVLTGHVDDVPAALEAFDLFVMPSLLAEGRPMVVMEAMAVGLPVIGSDVAGVRDLIRHEVDGALVRPGDPVQLAESIRWASEKPARWKSLSEQARRRQQALFSAEKMAERTAAVYAQLAAEVAPTLR